MGSLPLGVGPPNGVDSLGRVLPLPGTGEELALGGHPLGVIPRNGVDPVGVESLGCQRRRWGIGRDPGPHPQGVPRRPGLMPVTGEHPQGRTPRPAEYPARNNGLYITTLYNTKGRAPELFTL